MSTLKDSADTLQARMEALAARIASGDTLGLDSLPGDFQALPEVQRLLQFARVAQVLAQGVAPEAAPIPAEIGPWRLGRCLGSGGMGEVWLGERSDGTVEQRVAIKRVRGVSAEFNARLTVERRILARLSHPNIARFIDAGVDAGGAPWLALEYIEGDTLTAWCDRVQPGLDARLRLFLDVCSAVEHAHRHLVVHRDLKPANVLVDASGAPHLLDFGIARLLDGSAAELTSSAMTPAYAAPEQLRGGEISTATDVYSLGLLLYRLLAGTLPETRRDAHVAVLLTRVENEETQQPSRSARDQAQLLPYAPAQLAGDLDAIVSRAIRAAPEARYPSVAALAEDIRNFLESRPVSARAPTRRYLFSRYARRHRTTLALSLAVALALTLGAGLALWQAGVARAAARTAQANADRADAQALRTRAQAERAQGASDFVMSVFRQIDPYRRDARGQITLEQAFEDALQRIDAEFAGRPQLAVDLNDSFGQMLVNLGRFDEGRARLQRALQLAESELPADDPRLAAVLLNLGQLSARTGRAREARELIERAVAILAPRVDSEPQAYGDALFAQASVLLELNETDAAEPLVRRAYALHEQHLAADDPRRAQAPYNLATLLRQQRNDAAAKPYLDEAVARAEQLQGADAAVLVDFLDSQRANANVLLDPKRERAAATRMLEVARANFPGDHPVHAHALVAVGTIKLRDFNDPQGEVDLRQAAAMYRRLDHPMEARAWRMIGWTRNFWELHAEALAALDEGHQRCRSIGPAEAECLAIAAERIGSLVQLERGAEAIAASAELDRTIAEHGALGMDTREMADEARAEALVAGGRNADAVAVFDRLLLTYAERYGADSDIVKRMRSRRDQLAGTGAAR